jgi:hypothetical protein
VKQQTTNRKSKMKINNVEFKEDSNVDVRAIIVTPQLAKVAIENMSKTQRPCSLGKVREYAKEMTDGKWKVSNDAMVVCGDEWVNANHRLHAIVESGVAVTMLCLRSPDSSIIRVLDGGKPRSISDVLKMETGTSYHRVVAAIANLVLPYQRGMLTSGGTNTTNAAEIAIKRLTTRQERIAFVVKHQKAFLEIAIFVEALYNKYGPIMPTSMAGAVYHIIFLVDGKSAAEDYITGIYTGDNISGAQKMIRQSLIKDAASRKKMPSIVRFGTVLKTYLSHRNGTVPGLVLLKSSEAFPKIESK